MKIFFMTVCSFFLISCSVAEQQPSSELPPQFEDGSTELLGIVDCSAAGGFENERRCWERVVENRYTLENNQQ